MKSILLMEDDSLLIEIYTNKLQKEGFEVEVVSDGEKGLRRLTEKKFDLLLLDIVLPKIDGWEILTQIQNSKSENQNLRNLKIIVLSNLGQKEEVERGIRLGATKYLIKAHYTPSQVIKEIKKVLGK